MKHYKSYEQIKDLLKGKYLIVNEVPIPYGVKITLNNGAVINSYNKGTYSIQGKNTPEINKLMGD